MIVLIIKTIIEGLILSLLLILICAIGIRNGAIGMAHLYSNKVQNRCVELNLINLKTIKRNSLIFKAICIPFYIMYILVCVYAINKAKGFISGFWQMYVILSIMNIIDRFIVDDYWVGHTNSWIIPGTEDLRPYITSKDKCKKWIFGIVGMAIVSCVLSLIMNLFIH